MAASKKTPAWKEALGTALSISPRLRPIGQALTENRDARDIGASLPAFKAGADEERLQQQAQQNTELHREQLATQKATQESLASSRDLNSQTKAQNAKIFEERVAAQKSEKNRAFLTQQLKGREDDSSYQAASAEKPQGYEFIPDPESPGFGFAAPPAWRQVPAELAQWIPGAKPGDMISHSEYKAAVGAAQKAKLEETKANVKPPKPQYTGAERMAIIAEGGDPDDPNLDPKLTGRALDRFKEKPPTSGDAGTWTIQEGTDGKPVLLNSRTGETKPAPNGVQKSGTAAKVAAATEKEQGPARTALTYATNYVNNGVFTGSGDEALLEKFFELAKPATGFRMTQPQMEMLQNSKDWVNSAEAYAHHAVAGTWFSDKQRKQIVGTMSDLAKAKLGSPAPAVTGAAPVGGGTNAPARPQAKDAAGNVVEWTGQAWVPK